MELSRACPTIPARELGRPGGIRGSPSPGDRVPHWGQEWVKARLGRGPWPGGAGLCRAGDWHCCRIAGAGTEGLKVLKWGPGLWQGKPGMGKLGRDIGAGGTLGSLTVKDVLVSSWIDPETSRKNTRSCSGQHLPVS